MIRRLRFGQSTIKKSVFQWAVLTLMLVSTASFAQNTITGKVVGEDGEGLPGATILAEGTSVGTVTDMDGNYSLAAPAGTTNLVFSFIGYATQTIAVGGRSTIDIALSLDAETLSEIVVVGYGTQKKSDLTGAIGSVDPLTITERGTTNPIQALQGSLPGVQVGNPTGRVGDGFNVTIRGQNSLSGGKPLYVVDGVITEDVDFLNPQDIAKIDVLKDASSSAIYGSRGSNGVIFITTKGGIGVPDGTNFTFDTFYGFKQAARLPEMMSYEQWRYYHMSAYIATVNPDNVTNPDQYYDAVVSESSNSLLRDRFENLDGFDWYDAVLKSGMQSNNYLSMSHRSGGSTYTLGIGYQNETGLIENEGLDKFTLRSSINQEIGKKLTAGATFLATQSTIERGSELAMQEAFRLNPFLSPYAVDENGVETDELYPQPGKLRHPVTNDYLINKTSTYNPLLEIANSSDETRQWNALASAFLKYELNDMISFKTSFSGGLRTFKRGKYWGALTNRGNSNGNLPSSEVEFNERFNYSLDNQIDFNKTFDRHKVGVMALQSIFVDRLDTAFVSSIQQPFDTKFYNVGSGSNFALGNYFEQSQLSSFAVRLNYAFDDKYLLTFTNRWDGSSRLSDGNKWNSFPAVAAAWNLNRESFLQGVTTISNLKLRVGYGVTGNQSIDPYSTVNTLNTQTFYDFNGTMANGWVASSIANRALTWERMNEFNVGVDFGLFNHKVTGSIDFYDRISDGSLLNRSLPIETGFESIVDNAASVRNTGIELMLSTINVQTDLVTWETILTFTKNTNSIESLYGQSEVDDIGNGWFIGQPVEAHYNYQFDGIWQADESDRAAVYNQSEGQAKVKDINNDDVIDPDDDRVILGSINPDWTGGLISRLKVGNFDFNVTLRTQQGGLAYSTFHENFTNTRDRGRQKLALSDWYVPENPYGVEPMTSNKYPQPRNMGTYWRNEGVGYYRDVSFVKINNISLGYSLPNSVLDRVKMQQLRVYVNVLNPFVFTEYDGYDPEWAEADFGVGRVGSVTTQFGLSMKF